jgi:hypothetical protein
MITKRNFEAALDVEGYVEIETKVPPPRRANDDHGHRFAVKGLVLEPVLLSASSTGLCDRSRAAASYLATQLLRDPTVLAAWQVSRRMPIGTQMRRMTTGSTPSSVILRRAISVLRAIGRD